MSALRCQVFTLPMQLRQWRVLFLLLALVWSPALHAQSGYEAAQQRAAAAYQFYGQAHQATINGYNQVVPQEQFNQLLQNETAAWQAYVDAQNAANVEAYAAGAAQEIAVIDTTIANWVSYIQNLYNFRNVPAYDNDQAYRAQFDQWVQSEATRGNNYIAQLYARRDAAVRSVTTTYGRGKRRPASTGAPCNKQEDLWCDLIYTNP